MPVEGLKDLLVGPGVELLLTPREPSWVWSQIAVVTQVSGVTARVPGRDHGRWEELKRMRWHYICGARCQAVMLTLSTDAEQNS